VLSWARQRVRDDSGLEKLLHEAALVSLGVVGCSAALRFFFPAFFRDSNASDVLCTSFSIVLMLCVVRLLPPTQAVEMSELALLVAEGVWEDLLQDTAETIACRRGSSGSGSRPGRVRTWDVRALVLAVFGTSSTEFWHWVGF
jgi:hypothetical protein